MACTIPETEGKGRREDGTFGETGEQRERERVKEEKTETGVRQRG